jgi:hypothetical protein
VYTSQSPLTPSVWATSSGDGGISYAVTSPGGTNCSVDSGVLTYSSEGSCVVRATASQTARYSAATVDVTFVVTVRSCANGGLCEVGNTGPGGGKVFFALVNTTFACGVTLASRCKYLEAAPLTGTTPWTDIQYKWSGNATTIIGTSAQGTAIGTGFQNTEAMVLQNATPDRAGTITRAYRGPNNLNDWYLPSKGELNELYLQRVVIGRTLGTFFSSTEYRAGRAYVQTFGTGTSSNDDKNALIYVRPVRAFG